MKTHQLMKRSVYAGIKLMPNKMLDD